MGQIGDGQIAGMAGGSISTTSIWIPSLMTLSVHSCSFLNVSLVSDETHLDIISEAILVLLRSIEVVQLARNKLSFI